MSVQRPNEAKPTIYILGAGVSFPAHLTMQTLEILESCACIRSNLPEADLAALPDHLQAKTVSLWPLYQEGRERSENYRDVASAVLDTAAETSSVAWLTPGHPVIFDSVTQNILAKGRERDCHVHVLPAISCVDTILAEVEYDPANGLLIYEAYGMVMRGMPLIADVATLLLQPSAFGSDLTHYTEEWQPDLAPLRDHLLHYLPAEHQCAFVRSESAQGGPFSLAWHDIGKLTEAASSSVAGSTLFIPPLPL